MEGYYLMPHPVMMIPAIGKGEELKLYQVALASYTIAEEIKELNPDTIIIISSKNQVNEAVTMMSGNVLHGDLGAFECPEINLDIEIDRLLSVEIKKQFSLQLSQAVRDRHEMDMQTLIPLYFINQEYSYYQCVHIDFPHLSDDLLYQAGMIIEEAVEKLNRKAVVICSTNLADELKEVKGESLNNQLLHRLTAKNPLATFELNWPLENASFQHVLNSVKVLLGTLDGKKAEGNLLAYQTFYNVGYAVLNFTVKGPGVKSLKYLKESSPSLSSVLPSKNNIYVSIAKKCILDYFSDTKTVINTEDLPEIMVAHQHGVYVTLQNSGQIYSVAGHIFPAKDCVATEIMAYTIEAIKSALSKGISQRTIQGAKITVDLVLPPTSATISELDPTHFGVIVTKGNRHSVVLPNSDEIKTASEQLNRAREELGVLETDSYQLEKFEVIRYQE